MDQSVSSLKEIGFDNGGEFKAVFKELYANHGMTPRPGMSYSPQTNSIIELLGNMLRTQELEEQTLTGKDPFGSVLSAAANAMR